MKNKNKQTKEKWNRKGLAQVVKALVLKVCSLQGPRFNTSWVQTILGATPPGEKPATYLDPCRETSEGVVHGFRGINRGVRKLARTPKVIKKKKKTKEKWFLDITTLSTK